MLPTTVVSTMFHSVRFNFFSSGVTPEFDNTLEIACSLIRRHAQGWINHLDETSMQLKKNPGTLFNVLLIVTLSAVFVVKCLQRHAKRRTLKSNNEESKDYSEDIVQKPAAVRSLQIRFLPVFWLLRTAFWMSGPYFYAVYASKVVNGQPVNMATISHIFLTGFAAIALLGPMTGRLLDQY